MATRLRAHDEHYRCIGWVWGGQLYRYDVPADAEVCARLDAEGIEVQPHGLSAVMQAQAEEAAAAAAAGEVINRMRA